MILYRLRCKRGHEFEAWFAGSAAFDKQEKRGQLSCPNCGTRSVSKALMAPSVAKRSKRKAAANTKQPFSMARARISTCQWAAPVGRVNEDGIARKSAPALASAL